MIAHKNETIIIPIILPMLLAIPLVWFVEEDWEVIEEL